MATLLPAHQGYRLAIRGRRRAAVRRQATRAEAEAPAAATVAAQAEAAAMAGGMVGEHLPLGRRGTRRQRRWPRSQHLATGHLRLINIMANTPHQAASLLRATAAHHPATVAHHPATVAHHPVMAALRLQAITAMATAMACRRPATAHTARHLLAMHHIQAMRHQLRAHLATDRRQADQAHRRRAAQAHRPQGQATARRHLAKGRRHQATAHQATVRR